MCPTPCIWPLLPIPLLLLFLLFPSGAIFTVHTRTSLERRQQEMINLLKMKEWEKIGFGQKGMAPKKAPSAQNWTMAPLAPMWPSSSEIPQTKAKNSLEEEQHIINRLLSSDKNAARELYDWRVRPKGNLAALPSTKLEQWGDHYDGPVMVDVNMYLRSISKVDDVNMEFTMHFTFRQEWVDERLYFNSPSLKYIVLVANEHSQRIFLPDTFFQNEKDGRKHNVDKPNVFIRVHNGTGRVLYSSRMTLTLSCPMYLQAYPLDTQTCFIDYASYAYTTKDLEYRWRQDGPIQLKHGLRQSLPSFVLSSVTTGNCTSVTNTGTYSCLRTILRLRREFSYYLLQLYVPSFMLVAVSTVSFWLDKDSVPARITLGTTVLLTVTTMASGINAKLPPVSYTKSVDIWIGVCTGFIFAALLEFSLVNWAARKELASQARANRMCTNPLLSAFQYRQEQQRRLSAMDNAAYGELGGGGGKQRFRSASTATTRWNETDLLKWVDRRPAAPLSRLLEWWDDLWTNRYREKSRRIDLMARVLFPLFFILFNIIYWTAYLTPYLAEDIHAMDRPKKNGSGVG